MTPKSVDFRALGVEHLLDLLTRVQEKLQGETDSITGLLASPLFDANHNAYLGEGVRLFGKGILNPFF